MKTLRTVPLLILLTLALAACSPQQIAERAGSKTRLSIATGGTGGVYYPYGGGIARVITSNIPNVEATAEVTAASVDNLKFLRDRDADLAFTTADTLADAVNGAGMFKEGKVPIRTIAMLYSNYNHLVTLASSPIKTIPDLRGKVISMGAAGAGVEVTASRILQGFGMTAGADFTRQNLGVTESVEALKDEKIDAFFWNGGLPTAAILDLSHTPGIHIRMIPTDPVIDSMNKAYGNLYIRSIVPKATYQGLDQDVPVVSIPNLLVVHAEMDEKLVYDITRAIFEHKDEIGAIHPEAKKLSLTSAVQGSPAPYHPGAIRYYEEQRAWANK